MTPESARTPPAGRPGPVLLARVVVDRPPELRPLYWRVAVPTATEIPAVIDEAGHLRMAMGASVAFDSYFNTMFEHQWRLYTSAATLALRVDLAGNAWLRLYRRTRDAGQVLLWEGLRDDMSDCDIIVPDAGPNFRQAGLLWFELTALRGPVTLLRAEWVALHASPVAARLALVFCTFNREADIARVLETICRDDSAMAHVARIIVVNQGRPGLAQHTRIAPLINHRSGTLRIVEQANFGGAGGFGRGLLEAQADPDATHVVLIDDDVRVESESLLRISAFFSLASSEMALGGHMLDNVRPTVLYEAGATVQPDNWQFYPLRAGLDLSQPDVLVDLTEVRPMHYNGWWMFAMRLETLRSVGMPLPCFIRGDDVEFGLRLHQRGIHTVSLPGVAIWHDPFYLKIGGWQLYYETRNMLIAAALHLAFPRRQVAWIMLRQLAGYLLTFRYFSAALLVRGIEDFLHGPAILDGSPHVIHAGLGTLQASYPSQIVRREETLEPPRHLPARPRRQLAVTLAILSALSRHWWAAPPAQARPRLLSVRDLVWHQVRKIDCVAVETYWDRDLPVLRRSRSQFRLLARAGAIAVYRLFRRAPQQPAIWRGALIRHSSRPFWTGYLGLTPREPAAPSMHEHHVRQSESAAQRR